MRNGEGSRALEGLGAEGSTPSPSTIPRAQDVAPR